MTSLAQALDINGYRAIALIGSGGKTTTMYQLAAELAQARERVLLTTTTKILPPADSRGIPIVLQDRVEDFASRFSELMNEPQIVVGRPLVRGKIQGIDPAWCNKLLELARADRIVVEADGSRERPLKYPASHEPELPDSSRLLVVLLIGLSGLNHVFNDDLFHRANLVQERFGLAGDRVLTPQLVADLIAHSSGYGRVLCRYPSVVVINQADTANQLEQAKLLAQDLIERIALRRVVITSLCSKEQVKAVMPGESGVKP